MPSENGWNPSRVGPEALEWVTVPGTNVNLQVMKGWPRAVLIAYAADYNAYIEPLRDADSACYTPTNSVATSNHLNGTAMDLNWNTHPFRVDYAGFDKAMIARQRELLAFYNFEGLQIVFWAQDWNSPKDTMHHQMGYGTYGDNRVERFIKARIRPDGFSTYKRGGTVAPAVGPTASTGLTVAKLSHIMGGSVSLQRYEQLLPAVKDALRRCDCTNLNRVAMWMAQIGHESAGLKYMEEIASGSAYEGRSDLGNTQPGDGVRFKGHGPIQITGRHNHTKVSEWAHKQGIVPTPTYFVDHPAEMASDRYGFVGVIWYWTVARPQINSMCDANNLDGVTRAINGGLNGLSDRRARWERAKSSLGAEVLDYKAPPPPISSKEKGLPMALSDAEQRAMYNEIMERRHSRSPLRRVGSQWTGDMGDVAYNTDGSVHVILNFVLAVCLGDPDSINLLREVANNNESDRVYDKRLAQAMLNLINKAPPKESAPPTGAEPGVDVVQRVSAPVYVPPVEVEQPYVPEPYVPEPYVPEPYVPPAPVVPLHPVPESGLFAEITSLTSQLRVVSETVTKIVEGNDDKESE